jgi:hypothetical protein
VPGINIDEQYIRTEKMKDWKIRQIILSDSIFMTFRKKTGTIKVTQKT